MPDDLVQDKIDVMITYRFENGDHEDDDDLAARSLEELLADKDLRLKILIVPRSLITNGARPLAHKKVRLGDESEVLAPVYLACFTLGPIGPISVTALALGDELVLGVGVMDRFTVMLERVRRLFADPWLFQLRVGPWPHLLF